MRYQLYRISLTKLLFASDGLPNRHDQHGEGDAGAGEHEFESNEESLPNATEQQETSATQRISSSRTQDQKVCRRLQRCRGQSQLNFSGDCCLFYLGIPCGSQTVRSLGKQTAAKSVVSELMDIAMPDDDPIAAIKKVT